MSRGNYSFPSDAGARGRKLIPTVVAFNSHHYAYIYIHTVSRTIMTSWEVVVLLITPKWPRDTSCEYHDYYDYETNGTKSFSGNGNNYTRGIPQLL